MILTLSLIAGLVTSWALFGFIAIRSRKPKPKRKLWRVITRASGNDVTVFVESTKDHYNRASLTIGQITQHAEDFDDELARLHALAQERASSLEAHPDS